MILAILLTQELQLEYKHVRGDAYKTRSDMTLTLKVDGSEAMVNFILMSIEFMSFQKIHMVAAGSTEARKVDGGTAKFRTKPETANFDGTYDDEPFSYDFDYGGGKPPEDKMGQMLWGLGSEQQNYSVGTDGAFLNLKTQEDATGEAMGFMQRLAPRLPDGGLVEVGKEWTVKWKGTRDDDEKRGKYEYAQTCKVERVENGTAVVSVSLSGELKLKPEIAESYKATRTEAGQTCASKGTAWFDIEAGRVTRIEYDGQVKAFFRGPDPDNAARYELEVLFTLQGTYEEK